MMKTLVLFVSITAFLLPGCKPAEKESTPKEWAVWMGESDMQRNPESWMIDFAKKPKWGYCQGLVCSAQEKLWETTGDKKFLDYVKNGYADTLIDEDGNIRTYNMTDYNIDKVNSGKFLFDLYEETGDNRYLTAIHTLRDQMRTHPRTTEGGFWHKKRYPHQMWLDGLYMATPFLAEYASELNEDSLFYDVANQIKLVNKHLKDPETGLYRHGWDESHEQRWADPETGLSQHVWGRGMGWYAMAIVDALDFIPGDHPERDSIEAIARHMADVIKEYQDEESGVWYQVVDMGGKEGNYLESTASTMFVYFLIKSINQGIIDPAYKATAKRGYQGILDEFIRKNDDGTISITNCCAGAGLGGNPYRDGTYDYYINEHVRDDDPKAVGPFIMLALEFEKAE